MYLYSLGENSWTRLFSESATQTLPSGSAAIPLGKLNWPLPDPASPKAKEKQNEKQVVKVSSSPWVVPSALLATTRKW